MIVKRDFVIIFRKIKNVKFQFDGELTNAPFKAPSDEGAVSKADWGRETVANTAFSLPPAKIKDFCHLPHQREAWVLCKF